MSTSSEDELDDTEVRFQEAFGARLFRQGKLRALLEVKSPNIPTAIYEARLGATTEQAPKSPLRRCERSDRNLTLAAHLFHVCSAGSRDGSELGMAGAHALRSRLPQEHRLGK